MANAHSEIKTKVVQQTVKAKRYHLDLSEREAVVLFLLVGSVTGDFNSLRKITSDIYEALYLAKVPHLDDVIPGYVQSIDYSGLDLCWAEAFSND